MFQKPKEVNRGTEYAEISYEECERKRYSSGVEIESVGRLYSKLFQNKRRIEFWVVDKNGAVKSIENKNIEAIVQSWFGPLEMKAAMTYLNTGKWYSW